MVSGSQLQVAKLAQMRHAAPSALGPSRQRSDNADPDSGTTNHAQSSLCSWVTWFVWGP